MELASIRNHYDQKIDDNKGCLDLLKADEFFSHEHAAARNYVTIFELLETEQLTFEVEKGKTFQDENSITYYGLYVSKCKNLTKYGVNQGYGSFSIVKIADNDVQFLFSSATVEYSFTSFVDSISENKAFDKEHLLAVAEEINLTFKDFGLTANSYRNELKIFGDNPTATWALNILNDIGIHIEKLGFRYLTDNNEHSDLYLNAMINIGGETINFDFEPSLNDNLAVGNWILHIRDSFNISSAILFLEKCIKKIGLTEFCEEFGFSQLFPQELKNLDFEITNIEILFNTACQQIFYVQFEICSESPWKLTEDFTIKNLRLVTNVAFSGKPSISARIYGSFEVDNALELDISIDVSTDPNKDWEFNICGKAELDSISKLSLLPASLNMDELAIPKDFMTLDELDLEVFSIVFNPFKQTFSNITFSLNAMLTLSLFDGMLSVSNPYIYLEVCEPFNKGARQISGEIHCDASVAGLDIHLKAKKTLDCWSFEGTAAEYRMIKIGTLIEKYGNIDLPKVLEDIVVKNISLKFDTGENAKHIAFGFDTNFELSNKKVTIHFTTDINKNNNIFEKEFAGSFYIDKYGFELDFDQIKTLEAKTTNKFVAKMKAGTKVNISKIIEDFFDITGFSLPTELPNFELSNFKISFETSSKDFELTATCETGWEIHLGITTLKIPKVDVSIKHLNNATTCIISGKLEIGDKKVEVSYDSTKGLILGGSIGEINTMKIITNILGEDISSSLSIPSDIPLLDFKNVYIGIDLVNLEFGVSGEIDNIGSALLIIKRTGGKWGFAIGAALSDDFKFSKISSVLSELDALKFSNTSLVLSSYKDEKFILSGKQHITGSIVAGLNLLMTVTMKDSDKKELKILHDMLHVDILQIQCALSTSSALIKGKFEGELKFLECLALKGAYLQLKAQPDNLEISVGGKLSLEVSDKVIELEGGIAVLTTGAEFYTSAKGEWDKPFGIDGVTLSDLAFEGGMNYSGVPKIGLSGQAKIKEFEGSVGVVVDSITPLNSLLRLKFNELTVKTILDICDREVLKSIPKEYDDVLENGWKDVDVHIVPKDTSIGGVSYEQGFKLKGKMDLFGNEAEADVQIDVTSGIKSSASMTPIKLNNIFEITGANDDKPNFILDLNLKDPIKAHLSGKLNLLGISSTIYADITKDGFKFKVSENLYSLLAISLDDCILGKSGFKATGNIDLQLGDLGPITVGGVKCIDSIPNKTGFKTISSMSIDDNGFKATLKGNFTVAGKLLKALNFEFIETPKDFKELYDKIVDKLESEIANNFKEIFVTLTAWANSVKSGVIHSSENLGEIGKNVYNSTTKEIVEVGKLLDKGIEEIIQILIDFYGKTSQDLLELARLLKDVEYGLYDILIVIKDKFGIGLKELAKIINEFGYGVWDAICFARKIIGINENEMSPEVLVPILLDAGFSENVILNDTVKTFGDDLIIFMKVLKLLGINDHEDISKHVNDCFGNVNSEVLKEAMETAGYAKSVIKNTIDK